MIVLITIESGGIRRVRAGSGTIGPIRWSERGGSLGNTVGINGSGPAWSDPFRVSELGWRGRGLGRGRGYD